MLIGSLPDLYAEHAIGGVIGLIFNALFADSHLIALDGVNTSVPGGWIEHNYKQLYIQVAYVFATCGYSFVVTAVIAKAIDLIPGLALRATPEMESIGMDDAQVRLRFPHHGSCALRTVLTRARTADRRVRDGLHRGAPELHRLDAARGPQGLRHEGVRDGLSHAVRGRRPPCTPGPRDEQQPAGFKRTKRERGSRG